MKFWTKSFKERKKIHRVTAYRHNQQQTILPRFSAAHAHPGQSPRLYVNRRRPCGNPAHGSRIFTVRVRLENACLGFQLVTAFLYSNRQTLQVFNKGDQSQRTRFHIFIKLQVRLKFKSELSTHVHSTLSSAKLMITLRVKSLFKFNNQISASSLV